MQRPIGQRCATCRWWSSFYPDRTSICMSGESEGGEPKYTKSSAVAYDYEDFRAQLHTSELAGIPRENLTMAKHPPVVNFRDRVVLEFDL